jgi:hypothetical protein
MSADLKGYYARLDVMPSASDAEIKAAYRRLAKKSHPDVNQNSDDGAYFKSITEAYRVLGNPEARAEYDSLSVTNEATTQTGSSARIEPIACSNCGKVTAQPRYVAFRHVVSFIFGTVRTPIQGIFCARCANSKALRATAVSAVAGWWGVPWGPIWTVLEGAKNALGGYTIKAANENLLWHNALAFATSGNDSLSLALADKLRSAQDRQVAANAAKLIEHYRLRGITLGSKSLKNPWALQPLIVIAQFAMISLVPAALAFAIYSSSSGTIGGYRNLSSGQSPYSASPDLSTFSEPPTASTTVAAPAPELTTTPTCKSPPINGRILTGKRFLAEKGHILDINNGSSGDAIVKLRHADTLKLAASFFIQSNQVSSLRGIPDGNYVIQYAFGPKLASDCKSFASIETAGQFPDSESFTTEKTEDVFGTSIRRMHISYTLYAVPGGNTRPNAIDASSFDAS